MPVLLASSSPPVRFVMVKAVLVHRSAAKVSELALPLMRMVSAVWPSELLASASDV